MINYFVVYSYMGNVGNIDISRPNPIVDRDDILDITDIVANELGYDSSCNLAILSWQRYERPD